MNKHGSPCIRILCACVLAVFYCQTLCATVPSSTLNAALLPKGIETGMNNATQDFEKTYAENKRFFMRVFGSYAKEGIVNNLGLALLKAVKTDNVRNDTEMLAEFNRVTLYFKNIRRMKAQKIRADFPQEFFNPLQVPIGIDREQIMLHLIEEGCLDDCLGCPVNKHKKMRITPFPIIIMISKALIAHNLEIATEWEYEPLYYEDISGALFIDALRVLDIDNINGYGLITYGGMPDHASVKKNIQALQETYAELYINLSIHLMGRKYTYFRQKARALSPKSTNAELDAMIVKLYVEYLVSFIEKFHHQSVKVRFYQAPKNWRGLEKRRTLQVKVREEVLSRRAFTRLDFQHLKRMSSFSVSSPETYRLLKLRANKMHAWSRLVNNDKKDDSFTHKEYRCFFDVQGKFRIMFHQSFIEEMKKLSPLTRHDKEMIFRGMLRSKEAYEYILPQKSNAEFQRLEQWYRRFAKPRSMKKIMHWASRVMRSGYYEKNMQAIHAFIDGLIAQKVLLPVGELPRASQRLVDADIMPRFQYLDIPVYRLQGGDSMSHKDERITSHAILESA